MLKWLTIILFTFITSNHSFAQQKNLEIKGIGNNLYMEHIVAPKESFYSIGRMYNVNPKELASFNQFKLTSGLDIGQALKIPLNQTNFLQTENPTGGEFLIPIYHTVSSGETLYRLGVNYNKVSLVSLKKWNHLQSDALSLGTPVIVGFLKVDKAKSPLADAKVSATNEIAVQQEEEKPKPKSQEKINQPAPVPEKPEPEITKKNIPVTTNNNETENTIPAVNTKSSTNFSGGYFKSLYNQQAENKTVVSKNGSAGIFKSTSGWQDGKYYCFQNDATPGTVLKISNTATGKSIFAKVLDAIPDIKQNTGLSIIISNAAADELGAGENNFDCSISYAK